MHLNAVLVDTEHTHKTYLMENLMEKPSNSVSLKSLCAALDHPKLMGWAENPMCWDLAQHDHMALISVEKMTVISPILLTIFTHASAQAYRHKYTYTLSAIC